MACFENWLVSKISLFRKVACFAGPKAGSTIGSWSTWEESGRGDYLLNQPEVVRDQHQAALVVIDGVGQAVYALHVPAPVKREGALATGRGCGHEKDRLGPGRQARLGLGKKARLGLGRKAVRNGHGMPGGLTDGL